MIPKHLTCKEVVELTSDFLDDALAAEKKIELEQHLLVCPPCTIHIGQLRMTIELTGELKQGAAPPPTVMDAFRAWKSK